MNNLTEFPVSKEEFRGSWPERFPYEAVKAMYDDAISLGRLGVFVIVNDSYLKVF